MVGKHTNPMDDMGQQRIFFSSLHLLCSLSPSRTCVMLILLFFFARSVSLRPLILMIKHTLQRRSRLQSKRGWVIRVQSPYIFKWNLWVQYRNFSRFYLVQDFKPTNSSKYLILFVSPHLHQRVGEASCKWDVWPQINPKNLSLVFWKIIHISNRDVFFAHKICKPSKKDAGNFCVETFQVRLQHGSAHPVFSGQGRWWWISWWCFFRPLFFCVKQIQNIKGK